MKVSIFVVGLSMDDVLLPLIISNCCMQHLDAGFVRCSPEMQFPRLNLPVQLKMQSPESKSTSAICSISNSMYSLRSYVAMSAATGRRQVSQGQAEHQLVVGLSSGSCGEGGRRRWRGGQQYFISVPRVGREVTVPNWKSSSPYAAQRRCRSSCLS